MFVWLESQNLDCMEYVKGRLGLQRSMDNANRKGDRWMKYLRLKFDAHSKSFLIMIF
jgi:hypothetical protein